MEIAILLIGLLLILAGGAGSKHDSGCGHNPPPTTPKPNIRPASWPRSNKRR